MPTEPQIDETPNVKRDKIVMVRLTDEEHEDWTERARIAQRTLSDWVRVTVNAASAAKIDDATATAMLELSRQRAEQRQKDVERRVRSQTEATTKRKGK